MRDAIRGKYPRIQAFRDALLDDYHQQNITTLADMRWLAVPFEEGPMIEVQLATDICRVVRNHCGHDDLSPFVVLPFDSVSRVQSDDEVAILAEVDKLLDAVPSEDGDWNICRDDETIEIPTIPEELEDWSIQCGWSVGLITTPALLFAMICEPVYNFNVVMGPRNIVEEILGMGVEAAIAEFEAFDQRYDYEPDKEMHQYVLRVARMLVSK